MSESKKNSLIHIFIGEKPEYDESALKRYAGIIRSFLLKDCSDVQDNPCSVQIKPLKGLRGSRNDKDALKIEVHSVLGDMKRNVFIGKIIKYISNQGCGSGSG